MDRYNSEKIAKLTDPIKTKEMRRHAQPFHDSIPSMPPPNIEIQCNNGENTKKNKQTRVITLAIGIE
jgi:hypothetical protein